MLKKITKPMMSELDHVCSKSKDGKLHAVEVVKFARSPKTALHKRFDWDNESAAHKYRLQQARQIIEAYVTVNHVGSSRAYISVSSDRYGTGGYQSTSKALSSEETRAELLLQLITDVKAVLNRFSFMKRLYPRLFEQIEASLVIEPRRTTVSPALASYDQARSAKAAAAP
jgi:hypothetical protein